MNHPQPNLSANPPIGRFAPSPTGQLHLGSLITAIASYAHSKSLGGQWLLRIEDTDFERCKTAHSTQILFDLERLGLHWDKEVIYQSKRLPIYEENLRLLTKHLYACGCSRKTLSAFGEIYPRFCLNSLVHQNEKIRLMLPNTYYGFVDEYQGIQWQNPQLTLGDVVVKRQNGMINYLLACAIDDGLLGITSLVRGLDILPMTAAQLFIQQTLALPTPHHFAHLPLLVNEFGQKLSKQTLAAPIDTHNASQTLVNAIRLLGMPIPDDLICHNPTQIMAFVIAHWWGNWQTTQLIGKTTIMTT